MLAQSDDNFFEALTSFVKGVKLTFGSDFSQGFIKEEDVT